jgi:hypothetical protein
VAYNGDVTFGNAIISNSGDVAAPVISNVQAVPTSTGATITWTTNEAATSVVNYGLTSGYGSTSTNASLVTSHSIALTGLSPSTTYHYQVSSADASNNLASSGDLSFTTNAGANLSGLVSDDFNTGTLDPRWTFYDPVGNSTLSMTGSQVSISVPEGSDHNLWTNALNAPRIRQAANNTDFIVDTKFDSALLSVNNQMQGITVEQNNTNLLRFSFHRDASTLRLYSASFVNGRATQRLSVPITTSVPLYLRVQRVGNQWTASYSADGTSWTFGGTYAYTLPVTSVGIFAGNSGSSPPAYTSLVDSFIVGGIAPPETGGSITTTDTRRF